MLPDYPKLKKKLQHLYTLEMECYQEQISPVFKMVTKQNIYEGNESEIIYPDGKRRKTDFKQSRDEFEFDIREIENLTLEEIHEKCMNMTANITDQVTEQFYQTIDTVTKETGNIIKGEGKSFCLEHYFQALEMVPIDFDSQGKAILPIISAGPKNAKKMGEVLKQLEEEPYKSQFESLLASKKEDFRERESNRKLVD